ncbi:MAG: hypothetical protein AB2L20_23750 [Mangrovibacterium sp.]
MIFKKLILAQTFLGICILFCAWPAVSQSYFVPEPAFGKAGGAEATDSLTSSPFQLSLVPVLGTHSLYGSRIVFHGSVNLVGGYTGGVNGLEMGGVFNLNRKDVRGVQMGGVFNLVGGRAEGVQMAGVSNRVKGDVSGLQMGGVSNWTGNAKGVQLAGVINMSKEMDGLQMAGVVNTATESKGTQLAGVLNVSSGETGSQVAGVINVSGKVKGLQLAGVINVADSSDYPIGLINIIKNGGKSFSLGTDESGLAALTFRSGGRVLYGVAAVGYYLTDRELSYAMEAGIGAHLIDNSTFSLDAEAVNRNSTDFDGHEQPRVSFMLLPELRMGSHFGIYAGPSISYTYPKRKDAGIDKIPGWVLHESKSTGRALHIGLSGGLRYRWQ